MSAAENDSLGSCQKESNDAPPPLSIKLPKSSELSNKSKQWSNDHLPVDIVLLTVEDCEFLACYAFMRNPIRRYHSDLGYVYFGSIGDDNDDNDDNDNNQLKVALLKCFAGSSGPGAAQVVANDAVRILRPRAIFSVGYCEGLKPEKTRLGDVIVSSKLTFEDLKTPVGKSISHLIKHSGDGWNPPLERPDDAHQVKVRDGEILSCKDKETAKQLQSGAIAREMEGQGVFVAAHNLKMEWVIVKGISHFADSNKIPEESWKSHACVMAASLVFNMLNDTVVFKQWPHYKDLTAEEDSSASSGPPDAKRRKTEAFPLEECQERLKCIYEDMSLVTIIPWKPEDAVHIDEMYTRLSWFKDDVKPSGVMKKKLKVYTEIFTSQEHRNPKRILVYGRPGIGKSTFCKKAAYDWSQKSKQILRKFDLVLLIKLRDVCNLHDVSAMLRASELLANNSSISVDSLYKYIQENQDKVLLILDGFDEYSYDDMRESPVRGIWDRKQLSGCTVVLTMRPTPELKSSLRFEINGFDEKEQVEMFSLKFLKDDSDVKKFYEYLKEHNLTEIAEIPLLLRMLCLIWTDTETKIETTSRADIYTLFIQTMLDHLSEKEDAKTFEFKKVDKYAEELSKLGKLAYNALLKGDLILWKSELTDDLQIIINQFTEVGLCHAFKPSRVNPMEGISFIHKSIQEYIAGTYLKEQAVISRNDENETFLHVSELDSIEKILKMKEVLKFASELSGYSACAILNHLGNIAEDDNLTDLQESIAMEETPALEDVAGEDFLMLTVDIFLCCSAETRQDLFPTFLSYIGSVLLINSDQLHRIANEHLLKSSEPPNLIFFPEEDSKHVERDYRDLVSVMEDLNAVVVSSSGVKNASQFLNKYPFRPIQEFFLKKEKNIMHLYFTMIVSESTYETDPFPYPTEMLKELIASAESTAQQRNKSDAHQSSEQNTRITVCSTQDTDSTFLRTHHCLSRVSRIFTPDHLDDMPVLTEVLPLVIAPKAISWSFSELNLSDFMSMNFTDKLTSLFLEDVVTNEMSAIIDTFMRQSPNLKYLYLTHTRLGKGLSVLTSLLKYVPHLKYLYLNDVMMAKQQVHKLTTAVHQSNISELLSLYHDRKGNPLPEDEWPSEDYWKERPWLVPSESEDESVSSAESEDEPGSSAESEDEPGSSAESEDEPGSSAESEDEPGSSAESEDEPGSSAESKDEPGSSAKSMDEPGSSAESMDKPGSSAGSQEKDRKGNPLPEDEWPSEDFWKENPWLVPSEYEDESGSSAESKDESGSSAESDDEPGSSATEITGQGSWLGGNLNKQEPITLDEMLEALKEIGEYSSDEHEQDT